MKKNYLLNRMKGALVALAFVMLMPIAALAATWNIPTLNNGETATLTITVTVDSGTGGTSSSGEGASPVTNTVTHTQDQTDLNVTADDLLETITINNETDITVAKVGTNAATGVDDNTTSPLPANEGEQIDFVITLTNNGPAFLEAVTINDAIDSRYTLVGTPVCSNGGTLGGTAPNITCSGFDVNTGDALTGVAVGESVTVSYSVTVNAGTSDETIPNTATVSGQEQTLLTTADDTDTVNVIVSNDTDIETTKTVVNTTARTGIAANEVEEGDILTYTVTTTVNSGASAQNLVLEDDLPAGLTYVASSLSCDSGTITGAEDDAATDLKCTADNDVPISGTVIMTYNVTVDSLNSADGTKTLVNTVARTQDQTDSTDDPTDDDFTETVNLLNDSDIVIAKSVANITDATAAANTAEEGDTVEYTIVVTNNGESALTNFSIDDILQSGLTYVAAPALACTTTDTAATVTPDSSNVGTTGAIQCALDQLANGESATMVFRATVDAGEAGNVITNTATTAQDQDDLNSTTDTPSVDLTIDTVDVVIEKCLTNPATGDTTCCPLAAASCTPPAGLVVNEGDTLTYTIRVLNNGSTPITDVDILDNLPAGVTIGTIGTPTTDGTSAGGTVTP